MTSTAATKRNRKSGQYTFTGGFDRLCICGRTFGEHLAEAPHPFDECDGGPECLRFKPAKAVR